MTASPGSVYIAFNLGVAVALVMIFLSTGSGDGSEPVGVVEWYGDLIAYVVPFGAVLAGVMNERSVRGRSSPAPEDGGR